VADWLSQKSVPSRFSIVGVADLAFAHNVCHLESSRSGRLAFSKKCAISF
jgi:hypothetical protein